MSGRGYRKYRPKSQQNRHQDQRNNAESAVPITHHFNFQCNLGLVESKPWKQYTISFEGLSELIDHVWDKFYFDSLTLHSDSDDDIEMTISKSCFQYYIWQHVYARIVEIKSFRQTLDSNRDIEKFKVDLENIQDSYLPIEIVNYLSAIGDITDATGANYIVDFPVFPNEEGHFGRVTKDTHYKYETMAAPLVLAQRIMQDLAYTKNGGKPTWNLPEELVPLENNAGLPTKNLVGWDISEKLNQYQRKRIEDMGITVDNFPATIRRFMWNKTLFRKISYSLQNNTLKLSHFKDKLIVGSQSQIPWMYAESRSRSKYSDGPLVLTSWCRLNDRVFNEASVFCFRVRKDKVGSSDNYCCYDFNSYTEVPDEWRATRNVVFEHGDVDVWNVSTFESSINRNRSIPFYIDPKENIRVQNERLSKIAFDEKFTITFEGLPGLIDETYNLLMVTNRSFTNRIARSVFSYYIWLHLFARLQEIKNEKRRRTDNDDLYTLRNWRVPIAIEMYLSSIGDVENKLGIDLEIDFPIWPNSNGHFGTVSEVTHYMYEAIAAPAVLAQRIMEDLAYTKNSNVSRIWNLRNITPNENNAGHPTKNLLGWGLSEKLTVEQVSCIESAGITTDYFGSNDLFMINHRLLSLVGNKFKFVNLLARPNNFYRLSQMLWQKRDDREEEVFDRLIQYCERPLKQMSFCFQGRETVMASLLYSFRVRKDTIGNLDSYCCYDFNNYTEVPESWKNTRNRIFEYGNVGIWNGSQFMSAPATKDPYRTNWIKSTFV